MAYPVDLKLNGTALLLGLVNYDNSLTLKEEDVTMVRPPEVLPEGSARNSQTVITTTDPSYTEGVDAADVTVQYNRIDVGLLFSVVECMVREINIDIVDGVPTLNDKVFAEINRRYGLNASAEDFTLSLDGENRMFLTAKAESLAYIGTREIRIISSLSTLVQMPVLDGFYVDYVDGVHVLVPNEAYPVNSVYVTSDQAFNPVTEFGGEWTRVTSIVLTPDEFAYYHNPIGAVVELIGEQVPPSAFYEYVVLGNDAAYNGDNVEIISMAGGKQGVRILDIDSPLKGQEFEFVPSIQGSKAYMMINRIDGRVSTSGAPEYAWKRTAQ